MDLRKVFDQTVRDLKREVNKKVLKVPEIEQKVLDATSNEPWGPHGTVMSEIAQATRNFNDYQMIMSVLWKRLADTGKNWRHVYKALTIFDYLVAHGADRAIDELREHVFQIQGLADFQYVEPITGKDQGINVRKKAQTLVSLLNDKDKIREVRQKAAANRDKYQGYSSTGGISKPNFYSSTGGRGYSDWDDDKNIYKESKAGTEDRFDSAFSEDTENYNDEHHNKGYKTKLTYDESPKKDEKIFRAAKPSAAGETEEELDDFDPRGTTEHAGTAATRTPAAEVDFLGQMDFLSTQPAVDPFASISKPATTSTANLFDVPAADPFGTADEFGAFTSAPTTSSSSIPGGTAKDLFAADPFGQLSDLQFESKASGNPAFESFPSQNSFDAFGDAKPAANTTTTTQPPPLPSFQTKSSVWADSLTSGLIDLNITAPKNSNSSSLAEIGTQRDSSSNLGSDWFREERSGGGISRGKAMGSGSGLGLAASNTQSSSTAAATSAFAFDFTEAAPSKSNSGGFFNSHSTKSGPQDEFAIFR